MEIMAARSVDSVDRTDSGVHSVSRWRAHAKRRPLRYRLAVIAPDETDVVRHAGGWLFDRSAAGWEVTVLVPEPRNVYPLQILGATVLDLRKSLPGGGHSAWPTAVAVSADMYRWDPMIREGLIDCLDRGLLEVVVWGDRLPAELDGRVGTSYHRVSVAARAFKTRALAAAGLPAGAAETTERFRTGELLPPSYRTHLRDLESAG